LGACWAELTACSENQVFRRYFDHRLNRATPRSGGVSTARLLTAAQQRTSAKRLVRGQRYGEDHRIFRDALIITHSHIELPRLSAATQTHQLRYIQAYDLKASGSRSG